MAGTINFDMPLAEAMESQRAIRRLRSDPVDDALVLRLIDLALRAPTGGNAQAWEFVVVRDPATKKALAHLNRQAWGAYARRMRKTTELDPKRRRMLDAVQWQADHFEETPVIVVACLKGRYIPLSHASAASYFGSIFPSVQNLLLAARAANLGAALTTFSLWNVASLRRILGLPRTITPCAVIPLGWPLGRYGPTTRRPVHDVVSFDRFGNRPAVQQLVEADEASWAIG
jgi:nitroreductase